MPFQTARKKKTVRFSLSNKPSEIKENVITYRTHEDLLSSLVKKDVDEGNTKISNLEVKYHYYDFYYRKLFSY